MFKEYKIISHSKILMQASCIFGSNLLVGFLPLVFTVLYYQLTLSASPIGCRQAQLLRMLWSVQIYIKRPIFTNRRTISHSAITTMTLMSDLFCDTSSFSNFVHLLANARHDSLNMMNITYPVVLHTYIIGQYNPSVRIIDLVSHTTYVMCINFYT